MSIPRSPRSPSGNETTLNLGSSSLNLHYLETTTREQARRAAMLAFLIFCIYAVLRYFIYAAMPATNFMMWATRDTVMNGPRLLVLFLSLQLGLKTWGKRGLGLHAEGFRESLRVGFFFFLLLWFPDHLFRSEPYNLPIQGFLVLTGSSLLVGLWEEILYRGVFFNALRDWAGTRAAVWGSSLLFTVMHIQAQPLTAWPSIFLSAVLFALMRAKGISLIWLIGIHWIFDSIVLLGGFGDALIPGLGLLLFLSRAVFVRAYYRNTMHVDYPQQSTTTTIVHVSDTPPSTKPVSSPPRTAAEPPNPTSSEEQIRNRLETLLGTATQYRIRIHITQVDRDGGEKDLGPWPEHVAQVSRVEDAMDLCTMITHHLRAFLFPKERAS